MDFFGGHKRPPDQKKKNAPKADPFKKENLKAKKILRSKSRRTHLNVMLLTVWWLMDPMTRPVWEESIEKGHLANLNGFSIKGDYFYLIESEKIGRGIVTPLALILSKSMSHASF